MEKIVIAPQYRLRVKQRLAVVAHRDTGEGPPVKNIVICADGTGNAGRGTNVFKLYEAVAQTDHHSLCSKAS